MKKIKKPLATKNTSKRMSKLNTAHAVMACATAVFLAFSYSNQVVAQTIAGSTETTSNSTLADGLKGTEINYKNYRNYVTTGQPQDDANKIFLLYNVGAKKFLNLGGYWGTHAALSEVPRRFWLQRINDTEVSGVHSYIRYPEAEDTPSPTSNYTNPNKTFIEHTALQVGSAYGDVRTNATYNSVKVSKTSILGEGENVVKANAAPEGTAFAREFVGNLSSNIINSSIDLTGCKTGTKENILSIGTDIQNSTTAGSNINIYYDGTNIIVESMNGSTQTATQTIAQTAGTISVRLHKGGLFINNVRVTGFDANNTVIQSLTNTAESIQIGSANSNMNYSHATYASLTFKALDGENVVTDGYVGDGSKLIKYYPGSLSDYTIKAEIDLSNCTAGTSIDLLSIGQDISKIGNTNTDTDNNIHIAAFTDLGSFNIIINDGSHYSKSDTEDCRVWFGENPKKITVELNKTDGLKVYQTGYPSNGKSFTVDNAILSKLFDSSITSEVQVGWNLADEAKANWYSFIPSTATYTTLTVKKNDSSNSAKPSSVAAQSASNLLEIGGAAESTIYNNVSVNGTVQNQTANVNFPAGDVLTADIDLSSCKTAGENVLSIGTDITKWGYARTAKDQADNIHIYYLGKTDDGKQYKMYVANVNANHDNDLKRLFYVTVGESMKVEISKAGLTINGKQIYTDTDPVPEVEYDANYAGEIIKFRYADADNKIFKIGDDNRYEIVKPDDSDYEEADGIIGVYTGHLYTIESHGKDGDVMPYFITSAFKKQTDATVNEGQYLAWAPIQTRNSFGDIGVFCDRALPMQKLWENADQEFSIDCSQWYFEPVTGKTNTYKMYLDLGDTKIQVRAGEANKSNDVEKTGKFYLQATNQSVYGINLENYYTGTYTSDEDINKNYDGVDAIPESDKEPNTEYAEWKVISLHDYLTLFDEDRKEMSNMFNISYMLSDPDFTRENPTLTGWKMDTTLDGKVRIGFDQFSKKKLTDANYTDDNTFTGYTEWEGSPNAYRWAYEKRAHLGRNMGVDVNGIDKSQTSPSGKFYQTVKLTYPGWYAVKCGGITTVGSQLYVQYNNETVKQPLHTLTEVEYNRLNADGQVWPFCIGGYPSEKQQPMPMYNALVFMNDENLKDGDIGQQKDLQDATWHKNFNNQVLFYIDPAILYNKTNNGSMTVTIGIDVAPSQTKTQSTEENAAIPSVPNVNWTVFDNFNLLYGGFNKDPYLILDEDNTNLDYLDNTIHKYRSGTYNGKEIDKHLLLHRTFTSDVWNTIMLPVGLSKTQFDNAFGSDAKLAELTELDKHYIKFKTVTAEATYTDATTKKEYTDLKYWLKPMTPYIIKTTKTKGDATDKYTAQLYTWASKGEKYEEVSIGGDGNSYFDIPGINMVEGIVKSETNDESSFGSKWDFKGMTTQIGDKTYSYVMKGQLANFGDGTMTAYGHLAKNYKTVDGKKTLIDGRAPMADSYTMVKNKLTYLGKGTSSKGFRCWFQYNETTGGTEAKPAFVLDGVDMATGIDEITANDEGITPIDQYKDGIYTLGGQLVSKDTTNTDNLPKGVYIINGKKVVKK